MRSSESTGLISLRAKRVYRNGGTSMRSSETFLLNSPTQIKPNAAPCPPTFHRPRSYDFASPIQERNIANGNFGMPARYRGPGVVAHRESD